jgi:hypothetical protein
MSGSEVYYISETSLSRSISKSLARLSAFSRVMAVIVGHYKQTHKYEYDTPFLPLYFQRPTQIGLKPLLLKLQMAQGSFFPTLLCAKNKILKLNLGGHGIYTALDKVS